LDAPLDVVVARKIGVPGQPEFGLGAVTADGPARYDEHTLAALGLTPEDLRADCERERAEARLRLDRYRQIADPLPLAGRDVIVVDDGLATGVTARAALGQLHAARPHRLIFPAPVCARDSQAALRPEGDADEVVCLADTDHFRAVGLWYLHFDQTSDDEVLAALAAARQA
jgi:predicted phosphoribosyltransferase